MTSILYAAIAQWAVSQGAHNISGMWRGETKPDAGMPAITVEINGYDHVVDGIPPLGAKLSIPDRFPGIIGLIEPRGGALLHSTIEGEDEAGLIALFKRQGEPTA